MNTLNNKTLTFYTVLKKKRFVKIIHTVLTVCTLIHTISI